VVELVGLSDHELEVLRLLDSGGSDAELARKPSVSEATVTTHVFRLLAELDPDDRTQAAIPAHEAGLPES
jgi:DNA-binding NarL/FixJ family response regulator